MRKGYANTIISLKNLKIANTRSRRKFANTELHVHGTMDEIVKEEFISEVQHVEHRYDECLYTGISSTDRCYYVGMKVKKYGRPYFHKV